MLFLDYCTILTFRSQVCETGVTLSQLMGFEPLPMSTFVAYYVPVLKERVFLFPHEN